MSERESHTKGLLRLDRWGGIITETSQRISVNGVHVPAGPQKTSEAASNARRLVALWNALVGVDTEAIEAGLIADLIVTHANLLEVCVELLEDADALPHGGAKVIEQAKAAAAIAKAAVLDRAKEAPADA